MEGIDTFKEDKHMDSLFFRAVRAPSVMLEDWYSDLYIWFESFFILWERLYIKDVQTCFHRLFPIWSKMKMQSRSCSDCFQGRCKNKVDNNFLYFCRRQVRRRPLTHPGTPTHTRVPLLSSNRKEFRWQQRGQWKPSMFKNRVLEYTSNRHRKFTRFHNISIIFWGSEILKGAMASAKYI